MLADGQSCSHSGCLHHVSHPCEGCGRIAGQYPPLRRLRKMLRTWRQMILLELEFRFKEALQIPVNLVVKEGGEVVSFRRGNAGLPELQSARDYVAGIILRQHGGAEMIRNGVVDPEKLAKKLYALAVAARQSEITPLWVGAMLESASGYVSVGAHQNAAEELEKITREMKIELPPSIQIGLHDLEDEVLLLAVHGEEELKKMQAKGKG